MHVATGDNNTVDRFPISFTSGNTYFTTCIYNGDNHLSIGVTGKKAGSAAFKVYGGTRPIDIFAIGY